jgi:cyclic pyranopterin phosphate synthase
MVGIGGINDDEVVSFATRTINEDWHVRFIEFMPTPGLNNPTSYFVAAADIKKRLESLGKLEPCRPQVGNGPAKYFRLPQAKGTVGFITPLSQHFCFQCNRLRLTADGGLRPCLLSDYEVDLRHPLRQGVSPAEITKLIETAVKNKPLRHHLAEGDVPKGRSMTQVGG